MGRRQSRSWWWAPALLLLALSVACGGPRAAEFLGTYSATFDGVNTFTSPPGTPSASYSDSGTITLRAGTTTDLLLSVTGARQNWCTQTFNVTGFGAAVSSPINQTWSGTLTSGASQTTVGSATASINEDTLTVNVSGTMTGSNLGIATAGSYSGTWTGTRTGR